MLKAVHVYLVRIRRLNRTWTHTIKNKPEFKAAEHLTLLAECGATWRLVESNTRRSVRGFPLTLQLLKGRNMHDMHFFHISTRSLLFAETFARSFTRFISRDVTTRSQNVGKVVGADEGFMPFIFSCVQFSLSLPFWIIKSGGNMLMEDDRQFIRLYKY